jgi:hypothetical protein
VHLPQTQSNIELYDYLIRAINHKWEQNHQKDSVLCPLLECLIAAYENNEPYMRNYTPSYLKALMPLLSQHNRTAFILRCIDLLSSIVNKSDPQECLQSPQFM